jgi:putative ABC transport system permease protein
VKAFGVSDPLEMIGRRLQTGLGSRVGPVIGVVRDFHSRGLQQAVEPLIMECFPNRYRCITLTIDTRNLQGVMAHVDRVWRENFPSVPLETFFLDEDFNRQYRSEEQLGKVAGTFTIMGLIVACLGLLGLASFTAARRTKEIGIRKALGASIPGVLLLLSRSTLRSVLVANALAWPLTWWLMSLWLNRFAARMPMRAWPFLLAGAGTLVLALLTVSVQSLRAASVNPSDSLRYE